MTTKVSSSIETAIHESLRGVDQGNLEDTLAPPSPTVILMGSTRAIPRAVVLLTLMFGRAHVAVSRRATSKTPIPATPDMAVGGFAEAAREDADRL